MDKKGVLSILIIVLMIGSVAGFLVSTPAESTRWKGQAYSFDGQFYHTELNNQDVVFYYFPEVVSSHDVPRAFFTDAKMMGFGITRDNNNTQEELFSIFHFDVSMHVPLQVRGGYTNGNSTAIITCNGEIPTIYLKEEGNLTYENKCLHLPINGPSNVAFYRDVMIYEFNDLI